MTNPGKPAHHSPDTCARYRDHAAEYPGNTTGFPGNAARYLLFLVGISLLFGLIQWGLSGYHSFPLTRHETDGLHYMFRSEGPLFQAHPFHGPGYPLAIRLLRQTGMAPFDAARAVSITGGVIFIVFTGILLYRLAGHQQAMIALFLTVANAAFLTAGNIILSDMLASALFIASVTFLIAPRKPRIDAYLAAGCLCGLAYLSRMIFLIGLAAPLICLLPTSGTTPKRTKAFCSMAFYGAFAAVTAPWLSFLYRQTGHPFWSWNHLNIAFKMFRRNRGWEAFPDISRFPDLLSVITSDPFLFVRSWLETVITLPLCVLRLFPVIGICAFIPLISRFVLSRQPRANARSNTKIQPPNQCAGRARRCLWAISGCYAAMVSLVWIEERFLLPLLPATALLMADGLATAVRWLNARFPPKHFLQPGRWPAWVLAALLALATALPAVFPTCGQFSDVPVEYQIVSDWLRGRTGPEECILAGKPHIAFFVGTRNMEFRNAGMDHAAWEDLPAILDTFSPDYLVFDERYANRVFPAFAPLLEPESKPYPDLLQHLLTVRKPMKVVVYRVRLDHPRPK